MRNFKALNTNHTSFTVSNLDRSVAFFRDALGFEIISKALIKGQGSPTFATGTGLQSNSSNSP
ncbi:MAG: VOC family protein [Deltaproteobacteria bacterium]|nr:VOC family protein [Deltaproteobacteria bacterium]MBW1817786.1 VOC family protein [Deltaproteobacteria bacterium]MBW2285491.1 VOC family protein [Deltaproteobacteria bacterium]